MYLETILEEIKIEISKLREEVNSLKSIQKPYIPEYCFISDLKNFPFWPYSVQATRKMITRGKLIEGIHYKKVDGKIICNINMLKEYIGQNFIKLRRSA
jgi:hypothetical protein